MRRKTKKEKKKTPTSARLTKKEKKKTPTSARLRGHPEALEDSSGIVGRSTSFCSRLAP
jgi:hypothetical protein